MTARLASSVVLAGPWGDGRVHTNRVRPVALLRRENTPPYECAAWPLAASESGDVKGPVRQLRDPAITEDEGRIVLFYSVCGEQGIAAAEITVD